MLLVNALGGFLHSAPQGCQAIEAALVVLGEVFEAAFGSRHVRPVRVTGDAGEVELQPGIGVGLLQAPVSVADVAVVVEITVVDAEVSVGRRSVQLPVAGEAEATASSSVR